MIDIPNDVPKYRKKSRSSPPTKAKHKHMYEPCLIEYPEQWYLKPHERRMYEGNRIKTALRFSSYCPVCGKTGDTDHDRWWTTVKKHNGVISYLERVHTEEAERELNPVTRTLPVFKTDGWNEKFVDIEKE